MKLQITGNADFSPCRGSGCNFEGLEDMVYTYKNAEGQTKSFSTKKGVAKKITNEQLAFARAICAESEANKILNSLSVIDIKYEFIAKVNKTKGENVRGVSISFLLEDRFLHYKDKVDKTKEENKILAKLLDEKNSEMEEIEIELAKKEEELIEIDENILKSREDLFKLKEDFVKLNRGGLRENLIKILRARGMDRAEAIDFLN